MANSGNKITFGLKNVHVFKIESTSEAGVPTYATTPIRLMGAVNLSMSASGDSSDFWADDVDYYKTVANNGYDGSLEVAMVGDDFFTDIMGEVVSQSGTRFENSDVQPAEFAMSFEFSGDIKHTRHCFLRCKASRPDVASQTKEASITPQTQTLNLTAMARLDNNMVKAKCYEGDADYADWFKSVPEYVPAN